MAQDFPTAKELDSRIKTDVQTALPETNPSLKASFMNDILSGVALRHTDFYRSLSLLEQELLLVNAKDEGFVAMWGEIYDIERNPATSAAGCTVATGVSGTVIPLGTQLQNGENTYTLQTTATILSQVISISSITRSGTTATVTTASDHGLASNINVAISDAVETAYNGSFTITVITANTFEYTVAGAPTSPATGTIVLTVSFAQLNIKSDNQGQSTNLALGSKILFTTTPAGADTDTFVDFNEVSGGTDIETVEEWKARILDKIRNPVGLFNVNAITAAAKEVPGVTRVFVVTAGTGTTSESVSALASDADGVATLTPASPVSLIQGSPITVSGANESQFNAQFTAIQSPAGDIVFAMPTTGAATATGTMTLDFTDVPAGTVVVYFVRDNDDNIIPSGQEVQNVKDKLIEIKPAETWEDDVVVLAPVALVSNFTFTALTPNTVTMQDAITASLQAFFEEKTVVGQNVDEDAYRAAIFNTIAPTTGERVQTFALSSPSGDIVVDTGEIPTLGTVSY